MIKPNFLLVGAPKAGTTSIANYLGEHPEIFMPVEKEPFYFIADIVRGLNKKDPMLDSILNKARLHAREYYKLFENAHNETKIGEATVHYLYHYNQVIPKVRAELGDIPIVIVLRDPSLRAFSNYKYQSRGQINSFEEALQLEERRKELGYNSFWFYKEVGNYYKPVKAYIENFSDVKVFYFEELQKDPNRFMQEIYSFLQVDDTFKPNLEEQHNATFVPKNKILHTLVYYKHKLGLKFFLPQSFKGLIKSKVFEKNTKKINPDTYKFLKGYFKNDIQKLEELVNKDLSHWYE